MIIVFFAGLIIMASGGSVSEACNIVYLKLICNIVGGIMMGGSAYCFIKEEQKKKEELKLLAEKLAGKEELKLLTEKLAGKEEHKNEINILISIETLLKEHSRMLSIIEENQKKVMNIAGDKSEIIDSIENVKVSLDNHFSLLEKEISESAEELISKCENTVASIQSDYRNLSEDLYDQETNRTKKFSLIMK